MPSSWKPFPHSGLCTFPPQPWVKVFSLDCDLLQGGGWAAGPAHSRCWDMGKVTFLMAVWPQMQRICVPTACNPTPATSSAESWFAPVHHGQYLPCSGCGLRTPRPGALSCPAGDAVNLRPLSHFLVFTSRLRALVWVVVRPSLVVVVKAKV